MLSIKVDELALGSFSLVEGGVGRVLRVSGPVVDINHKANLGFRHEQSLTLNAVHVLSY